MNKQFFKFKRSASIRRFAMANWKTPVDPTITTHFQADFTSAQNFLYNLNKNRKEIITTIHLVMAAMSLVFKKYPQLNAIISCGNIYLRKTIDIFFNILIPSKTHGEQSDLTGTKIENCDKKNLFEIAHEVREKTTKIRKGEDKNFNRQQKIFSFLPTILIRFILWIIDLLTVRTNLNFKNLGVHSDIYGSCLIAGIYKYNSPTIFGPLMPFTRWGVILCINSISIKPWIINNEVKPCSVIDIGITWDHRLIDGADVAMACNFLKQILENPEKYLN